MKTKVCGWYWSFTLVSCSLYRLDAPMLTIELHELGFCLPAERFQTPPSRTRNTIEVPSKLGVNGPTFDRFRLHESAIKHWIAGVLSGAP